MTYREKLGVKETFLWPSIYKEKTHVEDPMEEVSKEEEGGKGGRKVK